MSLKSEQKMSECLINDYATNNLCRYFAHTTGTGTRTMKLPVLNFICYKNICSMLLNWQYYSNCDTKSNLNNTQSSSTLHVPGKEKTDLDLFFMKLLSNEINAVQRLNCFVEENVQNIRILGLVVKKLN